MFNDELLNISESRDISLAMVKADHKLVRFYIPEKARWKYLIDQKDAPGETLTTAMRELARKNNRLQGGVDPQDFNEATGGTRIISDASIRKLLEILNQKKLGL